MDPNLPQQPTTPVQTPPMVEPVQPAPQVPPIPPKSKFPIILTILLILLFVLLIGIGGFFGYQKLTNNNVKPSPTPIITATPTPDPTAGWKTYKNEKYRFEFKYPSFYQENTQIPKTSDLAFFIAFTSQDYKTESAGPLSGLTLSGSILTSSTQILSPVDFVTKRCEYLKKGSPKLDCKMTTISNRPLAIVSSQDPLYKTAFIEKDNIIISLHFETTDQTLINLFDQILSTFKFSLGLEAQIKLCTDTGATWLKQYKECEGPGNMISEIDCLKNKGEYFKCTSPCRHNPQAEQCETVCMKVCKF